MTPTSAPRGGSVEQGRSGPTGPMRMPDRRRDVANSTTVGTDRRSVRVGGAMPQHQVDRKPLDPDLPHAPARRGQDQPTVPEEPLPPASPSGVDLPPPQPPTTGAEQTGDRDPKDKRPLVEPIRNGFLVGVTHTATLKPPFAESDIPDDYRHVLETTDHIMLEGYKTSYTQYNEADLNYERLAHNTILVTKGPEAVHYLEEGVAREQLLVDAGMARPDAELYGIIRILASDIPTHRWFTPEAAAANMEVMIHNLEQRPFYAELSPTERQKLLTTGIDVFRTKDQALYGHYAAFRYEKALRDALVFAPRIDAFMSNPALSGNKAVFVGKDHMDAARDAGNGIPVEGPQPWGEFVAELPEQFKAGLDAIAAKARKS